MAARRAGWYSRWNTLLIDKFGPAQIGAGHPEEPDVRSAEAPCPLCGAPLSQHRIDRPGGQRASSTLHCP